MNDTEKRALLMRLLSRIEKLKWTHWNEFGEFERECVDYDKLVETIIKESDDEC
jgi:hypothetical protein